MSRYLVTGGTGFIGQHLVATLLEQNHEVVLYVRESYAAGQPLPPWLAQRRNQFELVFGDLRSFNLTARAVREAHAQAIIHLAAVGSADPFLNPDTAVRHNVNGTLNLMRAAFEKNGLAQRMIIARTPGELTHMNVYAASKLAAWDFAKMYAQTRQWPICGGMIFQCFGPGQPLNTLIPAATRAALADRDFPMTAGSQTRDWIHVSDVSAGLVTLAGHHHLPPGETVDLGSGQATSVADVVKLIYEISGSQGRPLLGKLPSRPGEAQLQIAALAATIAKIGWRPLLSLAEGLNRYIQHEKES